MTFARLVHVVDDDAAVRETLSRLLSVSRFETRPFASAEAFLAGAILNRPGCLLLDVHMPGQSGFDLQQHLRARRIALPIVFMTGHGDIAMCVRAMKAGAVDFLTKPIGRSELLSAVDLALAKSGAWHTAQRRQAAACERFGRLTPRECEVLALVLAGQRNKQIAGVLGSREATVKVHRSRLMHKLEARTLAELFQWARQVDAGTNPPDDPRNPEWRGALAAAAPLRLGRGLGFGPFADRPDASAPGQGAGAERPAGPAG